jgi:hypothetical protein
MVVPWYLFQNFIGVEGWGMDRWFLLALMTILDFYLGCLLG